MDDRRWSDALIIAREDREMRVESVRDAAICLKSYWPTGEGRSYELAVKACEAALAGTMSPDSARRAFRAASEDAGFEIRSWT
jgi:Protein of unknown function (DUF982)